MTTLTIHHTISDHTTQQPIGYFQGDDPLLNFKEALSYLRISRSTLYRLMWSGQLTGMKVGNGWRFRKSDLAATLQPQTFGEHVHQM